MVTQNEAAASRRPITPLSSRQLNRPVHAAARNAEIKKRVTSHTLRHSFATHLLEQDSISTLRERHRTTNLDPGEFMRRLMLHGLPRSFHRIRYYGLLASAVRAANITRVRKLLAVPQPKADGRRCRRAPELADAMSMLRRRMIIIETFERSGGRARAPPGTGRHDHKPSFISLPEQKFINTSGMQFNTIHANDFHFYEELDAVVQNEPADFVNPEMVGLFASIGIKKGTPFAPDERMKAILTDAVEPYALLLAAFGAVVLLTAWLPMLTIGVGFVLVWSDLFPLVGVNPLENRHLTERLTELVVIVSLMGAGLKLDRPVSLRGWRRHGA